MQDSPTGMGGANSFSRQARKIRPLQVYILRRQVVQ